MPNRFLVLVLLVSPALRAADKPADKTLEVLRDLAGLEDQLKALQKSMDGKFAELAQNGTDQARSAADQANKTVAALGDRLDKSTQSQQDQQAKTLAAVASLSAQVQAVSSDVGTTRQAVSDLTAALAKFATRLDDLTAAVKALKPDQSQAAQAPVSASVLFAGAESDRMGGKLDLALEEYTDFVAKFADSEQAVDAQYYIGSIHYSKQEWDDAVKAFDTVLAAQPNGKRTPEALYYKADSLSKLGRAKDAADTLTKLRKQYPNNPLARRALTGK